MLPTMGVMGDPQNPKILTARRGPPEGDRIGPLPGCLRVPRRCAARIVAGWPARARPRTRRRADRRWPEEVHRAGAGRPDSRVSPAAPGRSRRFRTADAAGRDAGHQIRQALAPQVVGDDHRIEPATGEGPGARLDVGDDDLGQAGQGRDGRRIAVHAGDPAAARREPAHVATAATSHVQHARPWRDPGRPAPDPRRRRAALVRRRHLRRSPGRSAGSLRGRAATAPRPPVPGVARPTWRWRSAR